MTRMVNRVRCSARDTENHSLTSWMPLSTNAFSRPGACCMNSWYSVAVQKPMTGSTTARLYQDRSNSTISPAEGSWLKYRWKYHWVGSAASVLQRHHPGAPRVQVLDEALDRAALAGGVAALEQHHHPLPGVLDPGLHLQQLDLQAAFDDHVLLAAHPLLVRVVLLPGRDLAPSGPTSSTSSSSSSRIRQPTQAVQQVGIGQRLAQLLSGPLGVTAPWGVRRNESTASSTEVTALPWVDSACRGVGAGRRVRSCGGRRSIGSAGRGPGRGRARQVGRSVHRQYCLSR